MECGVSESDSGITRKKTMPSRVSRYAKENQF